MPNYPNYMAGTDGSLWTWDRDVLRPLALRPSKDGYVRVKVANADGRRRTCVHVLVLETWVGPRPDGQQARHLNSDPSDNRVENLAWGTPEMNREDQRRMGRVRSGTRHPSARLDRDRVLIARALAANGVPPKKAGGYLGVSETTARLAGARKTYRDVE